MEIIKYKHQEKQVFYTGVSLSEGDTFDSFLKKNVTSRLHDEEGARIFEAHLRSLSGTGFADDNLNKILAAETPEERDWAIGEAMAEAYLTHRNSVSWPWNMGRDKRTPKASLPGADLVGFEIKSGNIRLALGEVKTSSDVKTPPGVMNGRRGMRHQIDNLVSDLALINQILRWLLPRCKGTEHEKTFNAAFTLYLNSDNKAVALFGVLIRDTTPNELDLKARGRSLANTIDAPATCELIALYLPCEIASLPKRISGDKLP